MEGRGNGAVLFGWTRVYEYDSRGKVVGFDDVVDEREAGIVREIVSRLLSGDTLIGVTANLNDRRIPAPGAGQRRKVRGPGQAADGSRWSKTSVKKVAMRAANAGLRVYHLGRDDEELLPAAWPSIVGLEDHDRVVALLSDPARGVERPGLRQHLLTWGIGSCGVCDGYLRMAWRGNAKAGRKQQTYVCAEGGCTGRNMVAVDDLVQRTMVRLFQRPDAADLLDGDAGAAAEALKRAAGLRVRLDRAAMQYADDAIDAVQLKIITGKLRPQIEAAEREASSYKSNPHVKLAASMLGVKAQRRWDDLVVTQRRAVLGAFRMGVTLLRVGRRGPGFDPDSVRIEPLPGLHAARAAVAVEGEHVAGFG